MLQTKTNFMSETKEKHLKEIGEQITLELAGKMFKDYRDDNPNDPVGVHTGKNILLAILNQPGCEGIASYFATNEEGIKTLIFVGLDKDANTILQTTGVDETGALVCVPGIVADRSTVPWPRLDPVWHWNQD